MMDISHLKSGSFVNYPKLIIYADNTLECPVCSKRWSKKGKGFGFVKSGVGSHIATCFEDMLAKHGLSLGEYNMAELAFEIVKGSDRLPL